MIKILIFLFMILDISNADTNYVYKIKSHYLGGETKVLTGFKVKKYNGIITALHGVLNANKISAIENKTGKIHSNLKIIKIDKLKDVALLSLDSTDANNGFETGDVPLKRSFNEVETIGFPYGVDIKTVQIKIRPPGIEKLTKSIQDGEIRTKFKLRKSPDINIDVVTLQGELVPGLSGAPIFNHNHQVFAIANGGIKEGTGFTWAIPIHSLDLTAFDSKVKFKYQEVIDELYSDVAIMPLSIPMVRELPEVEIQSQRYVKYNIRIDNNGLIRLSVYMRNEHENESFCIGPRLKLYDASGSIIDNLWNNRYCVSNKTEQTIYDLAHRLIDSNLERPKIERTIELEKKINLDILSNIYKFDILTNRLSKGIVEIINENF